jgi:hypothetical protein
MPSVPGRICAIVILCCLCACSSSTPTSPSLTNCSDVTGPVTLSSVADVIRVKFTVPPTGTSDFVLLIHMGEEQSVAGSTTTDWRARFRLYDGATLLGTFEGQTTVAFFKSAESTFGLPDSGYGFFSSDNAVADFAPMVRGTIDGRIEFSLIGGSRVLPSANLASVSIFGPPGKFFGGVAASVTTPQWCR